MKIHPLCELLPWLTPERLNEMADNIKRTGQKLPILTWRGQIIDGKNRLRACELAEVKPIIKKATTKNVAEFIESLALHRRDLTTSQRAMLAAELCGHAAGKPHGVNLPQLERRDAAKKFSVSEKSVKHARTVLKHGSKRIRYAVQSGIVSVSAAATVATLPKEEQRALAEQGPDAVRDKAAEMRAPWPQGAPPETKPLNGETKRADRETKGGAAATVAAVLKHLDKWWASEKKNLCSYPYCPPQRIWDLVRAEIVKVGA